MIPDRIHTIVPSVFEFPVSRKTFHELGSSSLEELKDVRVGRWSDGARIGKGRERAFNANICVRPVSEIFSEGDRCKENITLSLHYMVSMCKDRRDPLVDNHAMGDVLKMYIILKTCVGQSRILKNLIFFYGYIFHIIDQLSKFTWEAINNDLVDFISICLSCFWTVGKVNDQLLCSYLAGGSKINVARICTT